MVTRRCTQRQFLLGPSPMTKQVFGYCLALAQEETGMTVHAAIALSNHYHLIITDPEGRLPEFTYILNKYVAKCMNAHYGRWENFWAGGSQASYVRLTDDEAKLEKTAYAIANPVEAGLVSRSAQWPGFLLWKPGTYKFHRPKVFFDEQGFAPKSLKLRITPVPLDALSRPREVMERVGLVLAEREKALRKERQESGLRFLGVARIRGQRFTDTPTSNEPRRRLSPQVAGRDKWRRIEMLQRVKSFVADYRAALARWLGGEKAVLFPPGTYKLRVEYGLPIADA